MKSYLQDNDIEMYLTHNGVKSINIIIDKYNNTYHRTTKKNPVHANSSIYIDFGDEKNDKDPNLNW